MPRDHVMPDERRKRVPPPAQLAGRALIERLRDLAGEDENRHRAEADCARRAGKKPPRHRPLVTDSVLRVGLAVLHHVTLYDRVTDDVSIRALADLAGLSMKHTRRLLTTLNKLGVLVYEPGHGATRGRPEKRPRITVEAGTPSAVTMSLGGDIAPPTDVPGGRDISGANDEPEAGTSAGVKASVSEVLHPSDNSNAAAIDVLLNPESGLELTNVTAAELVETYGAEKCLQQLEWLVRRNPKKNPTGLFLRAVKANWPEPAVETEINGRHIRDVAEILEQQDAGHTYDDPSAREQALDAWREAIGRVAQ